MQSFFRRGSGRITLVIGGINLALMGWLAVSGATDMTRMVIAIIVPVSISVGIYVVGLASTETPDTWPIALASIYMFLGGLSVYAMEHAAAVGATVGVVLLLLGGLAAILGLKPAGASAAAQQHATR